MKYQVGKNSLSKLKMNRNEKSILVTGGAGFIGSSLCIFLIEKHYKIICLDNFDDFYSEEIKQRNLEPILNDEQFVLLKGDVRDFNKLDEIFTSYKIDIVIHLAAKAGVRNSILFPESYFDVNVIGTLRLLETMKKHKVRNLIFSSSSSVYGNRKGKLSETDKTDFQISPYAISKKTAELLTYNYHKLSNFNVINLRLFSVYGKKQRPDLVIHKYFNLISNNLPIEVYGDGNDKRDYTHIDDVVEAFYNSVLYIANSEPIIFEILNIGNSNPVSISNLIQEIKKLLELMK
jgi:UDP-glucuronate 4-epimerase